MVHAELWFHTAVFSHEKTHAKYQIKHNHTDHTNNVDAVKKSGAWLGSGRQ
jgi:hypothetical protein